MPRFLVKSSLFAAGVCGIAVHKWCDNDFFHQYPATDSIKIALDFSQWLAQHLKDHSNLSLSIPLQNEPLDLLVA
jgi:hypothetical protein